MITGIAVPAYTPGADVVGRTWLPPSPTALNSEAVNYANWYASYATRLNAAKTTSANAFTNLTTANPNGDYRVGFQNLGEELPPNGAGTPLIWVDVADWTLAQRTSWYAALFGIKVNTFKTPTIDAMYRIGTLVETGAQTGLDPKINPAPVAAKDPFPNDASGDPVSCTNNYHILFTDGTTNQVYLPTTAGDLDGAAMPTIPPVGVPEVAPDEVVPTLKVGGAWPKPYVQGVPAVPNTLSDVATLYWARDLRHDPLPGANKYPDNVPSFSGKGTCFPFPMTPLTDPAGVNCDADWTRDVAWWQHVNFNAISFGTEGTLDAANPANTLLDLFHGAETWPDLTQPNNPLQPKGNGAGAVAVDDLWHATVMSRGSFVSAKSPIEVAYGLGNILAGIQNQRKSRASAAFSGQVLNASNNVIFEPTIEPGWAGDLLKVEIDPSTGAEVTTWWKASSVLAAQIAPAFVGDEPWMDDTKRRVVTLANAPIGSATKGPGVPFQYAALFAAPKGPAMLNSLSPDATIQQEMISYLRGGTTFNAGAVTIEGPGSVSSASASARWATSAMRNPPLSRHRATDSTTMELGRRRTRNMPRSSLPLPRARRSSLRRPTTEWCTVRRGTSNPAAAGRNALGPICRGPSSAASPKPATVKKTEDMTAIQALTYQDGGSPIFHHHMYVDSLPARRRRRLQQLGGSESQPNGTRSWSAAWARAATATTRSMSPTRARPTSRGERQGALGVDESGCRCRGRRSAHPRLGMTGFTYGTSGHREGPRFGVPDRPLGRHRHRRLQQHERRRARRSSSRREGRTAHAGHGRRRAEAPARIPSGFAPDPAFAKNFHNQIAEQIYGGDLFGNFWRIDVSASTPTGRRRPPSSSRRWPTFGEARSP